MLVQDSLVPRPLQFLPHESGRPGRPGSTHHVVNASWTLGRRGHFSNMYVLNLKMRSLYSLESKAMVECTNG